MKLLRLKKIFVATIFTSAVLFADDPIQAPPTAPAVEGVKPSPAAASVAEGSKTSPSVQAMESIPDVPTKKDVDRATDIFLKGGFCVITALLFLAGFLVVKTNPGQKV